MNMPRLKLGVKLESLGRPPRQGFALASELGDVGAQGVQVDAVGDLSPDALSQTGRKDVRHLLKSLNLELAALGCPLRHGFDVAQGLEARIGHVKKALQLAYDLGPRLVVAYPGPLRLHEGRPADQQVAVSLADLGRHGDRIGATLALETGPELPAEVKQFLASITTGGLALSLDPASRLLHGQDPGDAARIWSDRLVHVHARDARQGRPDRGAEEVPLGHGDVEWISFLGALEEVGYRGWLTIKRGPSADPLGDVRAGLAFLRRLVR